MELPIGAEQLSQYFESANRHNPDQHWLNGSEMCRQWISLIAKKHLSQGDIDAFIERLQTEDDQRSGWLDLELQFCHWARSLGFSC